MSRLKWMGQTSDGLEACREK